MVVYTGVGMISLSFAGFDSFYHGFAMLRYGFREVLKKQGAITITYPENSKPLAGVWSVWGAATLPSGGIGAAPLGSDLLSSDPLVAIRLYRSGSWRS